jgi:hypothetical protein
VTVTALATTEDLAARLGRDLTTAEETRAAALLDDASALIRSFTGQTFTLVADDVVVLRVQGGIVRLPQRPVTAVSSVVAIGGAGMPDVVVIDYIFDGVDEVRIGEGSFIINLPAIWWDDDGYPGTFRITYSHGYATVPATVVAVACGMVLRTLTAPTMAGGVTGETIGSYSYRLDAAGAGTSVMMSKDDRQTLTAAGYRRSEGMIKVGR